MKQDVIAGAVACLILAASAPQAAHAALVFAKLSTTQEESIEQGVGFGAGVPTHAIVGTLNVIWSQDDEESAAGRRVGLAPRNTSAGSQNSQPPEFDDQAMSLNDSAPSLASTLDAQSFATVGDHRPSETGFVPSATASTTDSTPTRDVDEKAGDSVTGKAAPVATTAVKEAAPLLDLGLLPALLGILGATAFGFVATRRHLRKS